MTALAVRHFEISSILGKGFLSDFSDNRGTTTFPDNSGCCSSDEKKKKTPPHQGVGTFHILLLGPAAPRVAAMKVIPCTVECVADFWWIFLRPFSLKIEGQFVATFSPLFSESFTWASLGGVVGRSFSWIFTCLVVSSSSEVSLLAPPPFTFSLPSASSAEHHEVGANFSLAPKLSTQRFRTGPPPASNIVRGLLGTDPPDLTLESDSLSPLQGSIWHRIGSNQEIDVESMSNRCRTDAKSTPEEGRARRIRVSGLGGLCQKTSSQRV